MFECSFSPAIPKLLFELKSTLALTTYQAGKLIFLSSVDGKTLVQLPRTFRKPMGVAVKGHKIAVASLDAVTTFAGSASLAAGYPNQPGVYDLLFMPRATYHTGGLDIHDLEYGKDGALYAVNTLFSCIVRIDDTYNFTPVWKPSFIEQIAPDDACHLNGMALKDGTPVYATAFAASHQPKGWRALLPSGGIVIEITTQRIVANGLSMPHSPRMYGDRLLILQSATGELTEVDIQTGALRTIVNLSGFVRGLEIVGDYAFIGVSKRRASSSTFDKLSFPDPDYPAGVYAVHIPTGQIVGQILYQNTVEEIYDVRVIPQTLRPGILTTDKPEHRLGLMTPMSSYWGSDNAEG